MITKFKVKISFVQGAFFQQCPKLLFYKMIINKIKRITCINEKYRCSNCEYNNKCIYFNLSGENFKEYPAIIVSRTIFEKRQYKDRDVLEVDFYLIGKWQSCSDLFESYIADTQKYGLTKNRYPFIIKEFKKEVLNEVKQTLSEIKFLTPYVNGDLNKQIIYYNDKYDTNFYPTNLIILNEDAKMYYERKYIWIANERIRYSGKIGSLYVEKVSIDKRILNVGLGKLNFLGGGKVSEN